MSCDIDAMYEVSKPGEEIDDEVLIALVKSNPVLYNKAEKNFKNTAMKKDTWTALAEGCGASSGESAESRWNQLRNQFGRKLREGREKKPSGSGGGKKHVPWPLMGQMSFLLPHMENRKKRGSLDENQQPTQSTVARASPSPDQNDSLSSVWDTTSQILSEIESAVNSPQQSQDSLNDEDAEGTNVIPVVNVVPPLKRKREVVVPPADAFWKRKKKNFDGLEGIMQQSAEAMKIVAQSLASAESTEQREKPSVPVVHPYVQAMGKAFASVKPESEVDCLMEVLNVIKKYY